MFAIMLCMAASSLALSLIKPVFKFFVVAHDVPIVLGQQICLFHCFARIKHHVVLACLAYTLIASEFEYVHNL